MTAGTDTAIREGLTIGCLDGGGMLVDRNSGEFLPAEQVIRDPLHIDQLDFLDEDHLGPLKAHIEDAELVFTDESVYENNDTVLDTRSEIYDSYITKATQKMLERSHREQQKVSADDGYCPLSSRKGRWGEFGTRKP